MTEEQILIGVMPLNEAKRLQIELKKRDLRSELKTNEETCTRGCTVTVELWAQAEDQESLVLFLRENQAKDYDGLEVNAELLSQTFDPNSEEVICQACGEKFSPKQNECPDCGLVY